MSKEEIHADQEVKESSVIKEEKKNLDEKVNKLKRPASDDASAEGSCKQPRKNELIDLADKLGLKIGDRLEVKWDLTDEESDEVKSYWWGAILLEHDGRTSDDGVATRVLHYDPHPDGGFPDSSLEDVYFISPGVLLSNDGEKLMFRKEGEEGTLSLGEQELRDELNAMMMQILSKHDAKWKNLDAARQAHFAELMAKGKESIITAIQNRWDRQQKVISAEDIPSILEEAFRNIHGAKE
eukprot:CAMPEP_0194149722 /NCGR_PEP_ID=MMETSP0152-20130528/39579_1 /TAXON_ID=1049557 /ORGANISM="Thalassiothrix antarctica, Strain L6-D1" /LENGTH=238 /DNA_ID=CAMNT_0038852135 /DNA_START=160 /DNA_END=876 /DNA_ORIENTATION=-